MTGQRLVITAVCSAKPRASVHNNHSKGSQWWARDVYHVRQTHRYDQTLCGRDCSEWLLVGQIDEIDRNCCKRCADKMAQRILKATGADQ